MKTLKFKPDLIELIRNGSKTTTWRLFDDKNLETGDEFEIINSDTNEVVGTGEIKYVTIKKLEDLDLADMEGHEKYTNKEVMLENLREYYGDKVNLETLVKIIKFEVLTSND